MQLMNMWELSLAHSHKTLSSLSQSLAKLSGNLVSFGHCIGGVTYTVKGQGP